MSDLRTRLMELLAAGVKPSQFNIGEMVSQYADTDPQAKMLLQVMAMQKNDENHDEDGEEAGDESHPGYGSPVIDTRADIYADTLDTPQMEALHAELDELRERNEILANALGACFLCWGINRACPQCKGRGKPGSRAPDSRLFKQLVTPAVRRMRAKMIRNQGIS